MMCSPTTALRSSISWLHDYAQITEPLSASYPSENGIIIKIVIALISTS